MVKNSGCCKIYENDESRGACSRHLGPCVRTSLMKEPSVRCGGAGHFQKLWEIILQLKAWSFTVSTGGQCRFIALQLPIIDAILSTECGVMNTVLPGEQTLVSHLAFAESPSKKHMAAAKIGNTSPSRHTLVPFSCLRMMALLNWL